MGSDGHGDYACVCSCVETLEAYLEQLQQLLHSGWEYQTRTFGGVLDNANGPTGNRVKEAMNQLGKEGWELAHAGKYRLFFKRRLREPLVLGKTDE